MTAHYRSPFRVLCSRFAFMLGSGCVVLGSAFAWSVALGAQQPVSDGPQYAGGNTLVKPANYREWTFLGSGLGMTYDASAAGTTFTNVFVNPAAYRGFLSTGRWPDKSVFVLEFRASATDAAVFPWWSTTVRSAPDFNSISTISASPPSAAAMSGVWP